MAALTPSSNSNSASRLTLPPPASAALPSPSRSEPPILQKPTTDLQMSEKGEAGVQSWLRTPLVASPYFHAQSMGNFLRLLCEYFQRTFKGTEVEIATGMTQILGAEFWKECIWNKFQAEKINNSDWIKAAPPIDIHFRVPPGKAKLEDFSRFRDLCILFFVCAKHPYSEAILTFNRIMHPDPQVPVTAEENARLDEILRNMNLVSPGIVETRLGLVEIPKIRLFITLEGMLLPKKEDFLVRLYCSDTQIKAELASRIFPIEALAGFVKEMPIHGKERLIAYHLNARYFFGNGHSDYFPLSWTDQEMEKMTPLGRFLAGHAAEWEAASAALTLAAELRPRLNRQIPGTPVVYHQTLAWETPSSVLNIELPMTPQTAFSRFFDWMQQDKAKSLACLADALKILCPPPLIFQQVEGTAQPLASKIFPDLETSYPEAAKIWFLGCAAAGWKTLDENDLLDLPDKLSGAGEQLSETLDRWELAYRHTPYAGLFKEIKAQVAAAQPQEIREVCLQELMHGGEPKVAALAWKMWTDDVKLLLPAERLARVQKVRSRLTAETFLYAVPRVAELCGETNREIKQQQVDLLASYMDHLLALPSGVQAAYLSILSETVRRILEKSPTLAPRVDAFPRAKAHLFPPAEDGSEKAWADLQGRKASHNGGSEFPQTLQSFLQAMAIFDLTKKKGFLPFVRWLVEVLLERKNYSQAAEILSTLTVQRNDPFIPKSYLAIFEGQLAQQTPETDIIRSVELCRASGVSIAPELCARLFNPLASCKKDAVLTYLHDRAAAPGKLAGPFAESLLIYYKSLLESGSALQLLEQVGHHWNLVRGKIKPVFEGLIELLKKSPQDKKLWEKFGPLAEKIKGDSEETLALYESLTAVPFIAGLSIQDPPLKWVWQRVCQELHPLSQKWTDPQKDRLAKIVETLLLIAREEKKEDGCIRQFSSISALLGLLQTEETWRTLVQLYLAHRTKVDSKAAYPLIVWMMPRILATQDAALTGDFRPAILGLPQKMLQSEAKIWIRALAGLVAYLPVDSSSLQLIKTMDFLSTKEERPFFLDCAQLYNRHEMETLQKRLRHYHETGQVPPPAPAPDPSVEIEKILSAPSPTEAELEKALKLFDKCKGPEYELWKKFFEFLNQDQCGLCLRSWKSWLAKHPPQLALPEHGEHWQTAVTKGWGGIDKTEMHVCDQFIIYHLLKLLLRLPAENSKTICRLALKVGLNFSWMQPLIVSAPKLHAFFQIAQNADLKEKIGYPLETIDLEGRIRCYLLWVRSPTDSLMRDVGNAGFVSTIELHQFLPSGDLDFVIFDNYCTLAYVVPNAVTQEKLYDWISRCWNHHKSGLSWMQACNLVAILSRFQYTIEVEGAKSSYDYMNIYDKWVDLISGTWKEYTIPFGSVIDHILDPRAREPICNATGLVIGRLASDIEDPEKRILYPTAINLALKEFIQKYHPNFEKQFASLFLWMAALVLKDYRSHTVPFTKLLKSTFKDILIYLPQLTEWDNPCNTLADTFAEELGRIMLACVEDQELMDDLIRIVRLFLGTEHIRNAEPESRHAWTNFLLHVCLGVQDAPESSTKKVAKASIRIFMECTSSVRMKERRDIPHEDQKRIVLFSTQIMADYYLTLTKLELLDEEDWEQLFQGISEHRIEQMLEDLQILEANQTHEKIFMNLISIAQILQHYKPTHLRMLGILTKCFTAAANAQMKPASPATNSPVYFECRYIYIQTATALIKRHAAMKPDLVESLTQIRSCLATQFMKVFFFAAADAENFTKYKTVFIEALRHADPVILEQIKREFVIPEEIDPSIKDHLQELKSSFSH